MVARTDRGRLRERNEDCAVVEPAMGVAVLADGMGGLRDGQVASRVAVDAVLAHLRGVADAQVRAGPATLEAALAVANAAVLAAAGGAAGTMGTTAVVLAFAGTTRCVVAHVGDSRAYHLRSDVLACLTRDHSMVQELVDQGLISAERARKAPQRNIITRALGLDPAPAADTVTVEVAAGDLLLLCSDGLWDMLEDARIAELLGACGAGEAGLEACAGALVDAANRAGGLDNVSVVLARCG